ncbi:MAG: SAM-dependent methyltransferase [Chloroflexi bacterium]|nr:SAM-dependent methyltransferase [Chloroflexota bacterium]
MLDDDGFVGATFSGPVRGAATAWTRVTVRPVLVRGERHLQFTYYTEQRGIVKNYSGDERAEHVEEVLALPFKRVTVRTTEETIEVRVQKSGDSRLHRHAAATPAAAPDLRHDRAKSYILTPENVPELLDVLGMATPAGDVRAVRQRKLRQINEFLKLLRQTGRLEALTERAGQPGGEPVRVVDFGCGNAYLTFAMYHYLRNVIGVPAEVTGVDVDGEAVRRGSVRAAELGWDGLRFAVGRIGDSVFSDRPDIVLALHACDTATDEALARAIAWQSPLVVAVPCCHHDLQVQLERLTPGDAHRPLLRHSILRERLGDVLTDAFRALLLRIVGYQTDVLQFISPEHTAKNIMVRAAWSGVAEQPRFLAEYRELKAAWGVAPALERLLAERGVVQEL